MHPTRNESATFILSLSTATPNSTIGPYVDELPAWAQLVGFISYVILLVLAILVDTAILFVFWRVKELRNVTNNLLCNMVAADLLFALQTPLEATSILNDEWEIGNGLCKFHRFLLHTFYNVVILSLTVVSIERYIAICHPLRFQSHEDKFKCGRLIIVVWISSLILSVPQMGLSSVEELNGKRVCMEERPHEYLTVFLAYHLPMFAVLYFVPIVVMTFTYANVSKQLSDVVERYRQRSRFDICGAMKMRRSIIRMLLVVVVVFVVCLTPLTFMELLHVTPVMEHYDPFGVLVFCIGMLAFLHSLLNPLVSSFLSKEFRKAAKRAFNCPKKFELCKIKERENNNNCKLQHVTPNGVNESTARLNGQTSKPENELKQNGGIVNEGATLSFETLTETTELPKGDE